MNPAIQEGVGFIESIVLEVRDKETGRLKQRTTVKNGVETMEKFPEEVK